MAVLDLATIPSGINTYERLAVWAIQSLESIANGQQVNVQQGQAQQEIAQCALGVTADNVPRFILTAYLPCDRDQLNSSTQKTWMAAKDISMSQPHTNMMSN